MHFQAFGERLDTECVGGFWMGYHWSTTRMYFIWAGGFESSERQTFVLAALHTQEAYTNSTKLRYLMRLQTFTLFIHFPYLECDLPRLCVLAYISPSA